MKLYVIEDVDLIKRITSRDNIKKMVLHLYSNKKLALFESDYTLFDLTESVNYNHVIKLLKNSEI